MSEESVRLKLENAAMAAQHSPLCDDPVIVDAILRNVVKGLIREIVNIITNDPYLTDDEIFRILLQDDKRK